MARKKRQTTKNNSSKGSSQHQTGLDEPFEKNRPEITLSKRIREVLLLVMMGIFVFLIYSNNLEGPLVFDDEQNIRDNRYIRINELTFDNIKDAGFKSHSSNRPIPNITFALNYYFHQYDMTGYHVLNILIHIITGILLYFFIKITMEITGFRNQKAGVQGSLAEADNQNTSHFSLLTSHFLVPFLGALIWLVHPLQTQSVSYIVQRMNSMAAMFYILSFLCYVHARVAKKGGIKKSLLFACALFAGICALGSKEIAGSLPFFILLYEWYFFQDLNQEWLRRYSFLFGGIFLFLILFAFIYMGTNPLDKISEAYEHRNFTMPQRVLTEFRVILFYISLLIFPHPSRLNLTHDFPISYSLFDPVSTLFSLLMIAGLICLAVWLAKKERLLSFCIFWYFGNLVIESSVIGLEIIFEHRNYLPSMLVCLMMVLLISRAVKKILFFQTKECKVSLQEQEYHFHTEQGNEEGKQGIPNTRTQSVLVAFPRRAWERVESTSLLCLIAIILSFWTHQRNGVWSSDVSLWKDCVEKSPNNVRPYNNLGISMSGQGKIKEAMDYFKQAIQIKPDYAFAHNNLGYALVIQGKTEEAIPYYQDALRFKPGYVDANYNLANALSKQEKYEEAIRHYAGALAVMPDHAKAHNGMGTVLARLDKHDKAIYHYHKALKGNPGFTEAHNNLGLAFADQGKYQNAIHSYSEAIRLSPNFAEAHYNLGLALAKSGNLNDAIRYFTEAKKLKPDYAEAHNNLGNALAGLGKMNKAIECYSDALEANPEFADAHYNLGVAMAGQGKTEEAIQHYNETLQINPEFSDAHYNLGVILTRAGKPDEAIQHYNKVIEIKPDADAHCNIGMILAKQGDFKEAVRHYTEALKIKPGLESARRNMSRALERLNP